MNLNRHNIAKEPNASNGKIGSAMVADCRR
jgi:hypothetical protein